MHNQTLTALIAASATLAPLAAASVVIEYDTRAEFETDAMGPLAIEDLESEPHADLMLPSTLDSGLAVNLTSGDVTVFVDFQNLNGFQNTTAKGRNYLAFGRNIPPAQTGSFTAAFELTQSSNAFGFDISGIQTQLSSNGFQVTTLADGQIVDDYFVPFEIEIGNAAFYGLISEETFDEVRIHISAFNGSGTADYVAFDEITWGGVPTPGATSLLALSALAATRRRR